MFTYWRAEFDYTWWLVFDRNHVPALVWAVICACLAVTGGIEVLSCLCCLSKIKTFPEPAMATTGLNPRQGKDAQINAYQSTTDSPGIWGEIFKMCVQGWGQPTLCLSLSSAVRQWNSFLSYLELVGFVTASWEHWLSQLSIWLPNSFT